MIMPHPGLYMPKTVQFRFYGRQNRNGEDCTAKRTKNEHRQYASIMVKSNA